MYQKRLKWQSGLNSGIFPFWPVSANRSYWGVFEHYFPDLWFTGTESETTHYTGRKTGLCIPFWLADRFLDGLLYAEMERRPVLGIWNSLQNQEKTYSFTDIASPSETIFL
jgi:hypothetical protein